MSLAFCACRRSGAYRRIDALVNRRALAIIAYLLCIGACIKVLLPHRLVFSFRGSALISAAHEAQADLEETLEVATGWIEDFLEGNRTELETLTRSYTVACLALGAEIVLWLLGAPDILG